MTKSAPRENIQRDGESWAGVLNEAFRKRQPYPLQLAEQALRECPRDAYILNLAAVAALLEEKPDRCLRYLKRLEKYFVADERNRLLRALALAQQLCTESGGEGRNVQFCNTLINFDLPWNPMAIEQRIGRLHRIGQQREVFIFNLVSRGTLESHVLQILDEKINMFELVVGEIDAILGELDERQDFSEMVFSAWVENTVQERSSAFAQLGERVVKAKQQYESIKELDDKLFGDEFETA